MKKNTLSRLFLCVFFLYLFTLPSLQAADMGLNNRLTANDEGKVFRMADNFFIIYDPSYAMDVPYRDTGLTRLEAEKQILTQSNVTLPDLGWQTGLYPHWRGGLWLHGSPMAFKPYYPLQRYDQTSYGEAINQLPARPIGPPMLQRGLMKLEHMLGLSGRTEVFIFSNGQHSTAKKLEPEPLQQAQLLVKNHDVCFTIISSAQTAEEKQLVEAIGSVNNCSQVIDFDTVFDKPEHLFGKLYADTNQAFDNILFDFDKAAIKPEFTQSLEQLGHFLTANPTSYVVLSGYTDNIGSKQYNMKLSQRRANSVRHYLNNHFQITDDRILPYWYGFTKPVASNASESGRQLNRRVTITLRNK